MATYRVNVYRTYFLESEICDGDYYNAPSTYTHEDHFIGHASDLACWIAQEGLTFAASGGDWASDPDGSRTTNYATGQRVAVSAHFVEGFPERLANAIRESVG